MSCIKRYSQHFDIHDRLVPNNRNGPWMRYADYKNKVNSLESKLWMATEALKLFSDLELIKLSSPEHITHFAKKKLNLIKQTK